MIHLVSVKAQIPFLMALNFQPALLSAKALVATSFTGLTADPLLTRLTRLSLRLTRRLVQSAMLSAFPRTRLIPQSTFSRGSMTLRLWRASLQNLLMLAASSSPAASAVFPEPSAKFTLWPRFLRRKLAELLKLWKSSLIRTARGKRLWRLQVVSWVCSAQVALYWQSHSRHTTPRLPNHPVHECQRSLYPLLLPTGSQVPTICQSLSGSLW